MEFRHYTDPEKAAQVWESYKTDLEKLGIVSGAELIASRCKDATRLDVLLSFYVTDAQTKEQEMSGARRINHTSKKDETSGSFSNVVRASEEYETQ